MTTTYQIKATQVFNGEMAGRGATVHEVERAAGQASVESLLARYETAGAGWGVHLAFAEVDTARALGAYQTDSGEWMLPLPGRDPVSIEIDPTGTAGL